jgi:heme-degrading monooxygenase HmoA
MIVVIFESWPKPGKKQAYLDMAAALMPLVKDIEGFISIERFQSVSEEGKLVALSFWRDETAVTAWRNVMEHRSGSGPEPAQCVRRLSNARCARCTRLLEA